MNKKRFSMKTLAGVGLAFLLAGIVFTISVDGGSSTSATELWKDAGKDAGSEPLEPKADMRPSFVELVKELSPTVVNLSTTMVVKDRGYGSLPRESFEDFFGDELLERFFEDGLPEGDSEGESLGSGFIINEEGYILTNYHVVEDATEIIVTLSNGDNKEYEATLIGKDALLDIALIKIEADEDLPSVVLGDSEALEVGEWVIAIGNPFGLGGTVTAGIVSQKGRVIGAGPYDNFLQTDASINPGNSGGPLFNLKGEVVGINTAIISGGSGIGFAIPIDMVKELLTQLRDTGKATRGWLGVSMQTLTPELAESFGIKAGRGVLISNVVEGDPADKAGIKRGDIIVEFDGKAIAKTNDLSRAVAAVVPGKKAKVKVIRDGSEKIFTVKVKERRDDGRGGIDPEAGGEGEEDSVLGIRVMDITRDVAERFGIRDKVGVLIYSVEAGSLAADAGLKKGDLIKELNRKVIEDLDDYRKAVEGIKKDKTVLFFIKRGDNSIYISFKVKE